MYNKVIICNHFSFDLLLQVSATIMKTVILYLLFSSVSAITFDCTYDNNTTWSGGVGQLYRCNAKVTGILKSQKLTKVTGNHLSGKSNKDVEAIEINGNIKLEYFPQDMKKFFPNLVAIFLISTGIKTLNGDELQEFPRLKLFSLSYGQLERVPANFFKATPDIRQIAFHNNRIVNVDGNVLSSLENLYWVSFEGNLCINMGSDGSLDRLIENLRRHCRPLNASEATIGNINVNKEIEVEEVYQEGDNKEDKEEDEIYEDESDDNDEDDDEDDE